jgi:hypothetical protein
LPEDGLVNVIEPRGVVVVEVAVDDVELLDELEVLVVVVVVVVLLVAVLVVVVVDVPVVDVVLVDAAATLISTCCNSCPCA